ncbi:3-carboxy-cis,cis-muconate cycloisomerase [Agrobacterium rubi]|uniref:3-carboxy-cis,cis-muconate cycloisomerase n=2 Tax=Agrobacterium rubi TaxID=28099 RepID=A0AAE7R680_9HYPH|nr:3-carboxy-cis,cis-muconate cycloisomerase [Agrobacterium rubi]MBP1878704.1 3-carboxy-cis,cis-muconate cycloisomerase [Agrobacterium rubi]MCL6652935.1 3-carboxy-cis,cis-muconate cycloisomerase [Agrobacterium rubi]NTE88673.1 3-carboxy-cis,cis-muconate cycloisomerase [Agrobacterium rubi]NTF04501.1 3-carboxy-cis,cis-muconate cycloisomerase [Agrobacterium rubi]NTF10034.1 3-carboxy-cis,cis-muconate cycloisomerase [Agrobacterium rubi]
MSLSPFEHPFLGGLFADADITALFSAEADVAAMLRFEVELAEAQAACGIISPEDAARIGEALATTVIDYASLREGVSKDGVVIPDFVRQLRLAVGEQAATKVHFGATSQDVIDTSLMLRLKAATAIIIARLSSCVSGLQDITSRDGANPLMGYTRMQAAIPMTVADRVASWQQPLSRHRDKLVDISDRGFAVQFGGAAGTLEKFGDKGAAVRAELAKRLGLVDTAQWQSQRDAVADLGHCLALITGSLGKLGQDVALLAEMGKEIRLAGGGGSSAMPHKQNPVVAETLVTLARFNAVQVSALHHSMVHEQERSGAAWMLEWLVLPQMVVATGSALLLAERLIGQIEHLGT